MTLGNAESQRVETLTKEKEQQEPKADESQRQLATVNRELEQLQSQRQEESSAADREREQLARAKEDYEAKAAELERARSAATEDSSRREREREAFEAGLRQQQQKAAELDTEVAKRNAEIERLKKSVAELESRLAEQSTGGAGTSEGLVVEWIDPPAGVNQTQLRLRGGDQAARILAGRVVAPPGLRSISVNGRRVEVDAEGLFSVELPPFRRGQETANLELVAADGRDTRESRRVTLLRGAPGVIGQVPTPAVIGAFGNYYALVIGNNDYRHWDKLQNPVNDAKEIADVLRDRFGFKVTLLLNATREQILRSLNDLRKQLTEKDNLLIYYAGHGQLVEKLTAVIGFPLRLSWTI